jgi:hypothetical protein
VCFKRFYAGFLHLKSQIPNLRFQVSVPAGPPLQKSNRSEFMRADAVLGEPFSGLPAFNPLPAINLRYFLRVTLKAELNRKKPSGDRKNRTTGFRYSGSTQHCNDVTL